MENNKKYCVYITTYNGKKLPKHYIGSTSVEKINSGKYFGSVSSKRWKNIFQKELKNNPNLFSIKIYSYHEKRKEAIENELKLQLKNNVVKSDNYINESFAKINGMFGRDVKGKNNPMFGKKRKDSSIRMKGENNIAKREDVKIKLKKPKKVKRIPRKQSDITKLKIKNFALNRSDGVKNKIKKGLQKRSNEKFNILINNLIIELKNNNNILSRNDINIIFKDKSNSFMSDLLRVAKNRNLIYCTPRGKNSTWHLK